MKRFFHCRKALCAILLFVLFASCPKTVSVALTPAERVAQNKALSIASNEIPSWPAGPVVGASSAILIEAETGTVLYAKNIHDTHYPASTTKILTTLIASERCKLDEVVTFSHDAVFDTPRDSNHIAMDVGDTLTMEQCLNAILIRSANEVSFAVAEHISGSFDAFAELMNARAKELGCTDSHFVNPNGLPDPQHYTSAYDLAKIGQAFFANELLCSITTTPRLVIPKKKEDLIENNKMELIAGQKYAYEYLAGCKTGYTDIARYTIVACAEKNGMRLICAILEDEYPYIYEDAISLFNYGFSNFARINVSLTETKYDIDNQGLFYEKNDLFGNSSPVLALNKTDVVILPKTISFDSLSSRIVYTSSKADQVARIDYSYRDIPLGSVSVDYVKHQLKGYSFDNDSPAELTEEPEKTEPAFFFVNIFTILAVLGGIAAAALIGFLMYMLSKHYHFQLPGKERRAWKRSQSKQKRRQIREAKKHSRQNYRSNKKRRRR